MGYAEVSVNSPGAQRRTFSYTIPAGLNINVGQAVWVPFGDKVLQGVVLELTEFPAVAETREIAGIIEFAPVLSPYQVSLARWISDYYLSPLFDAVALMLPPGFERKIITLISPTSRESSESPLTQSQQSVLELVRTGERIPLKELEKKYGIKPTKLTISRLISLGLVARSYELEKVRVKPRTVPYLRLAVMPDEAQKEASRLREKSKASRQADLLEFLASHPAPALWPEVSKKLHCGKAVLDSLVSKGLVNIELIEIERNPLLSYQAITTSHPLNLTAAQKAAFESIRASLLQPGKGHNPGAIFLLHGVTGSGKTEVYLQSLAEAVRLGKRGIVLVPEISLTPQTIERFVSRFPHRVAILHSRLSLGEQFDEWRRIRDGESDVVIGSRSAIFAPQPDLGLIVVDEEHEWTYKQREKAPRYHARDVAVKLAELTGAVVILGSATPDVETFYRAQRGEYHLLELPERVTPVEGSPMPEVEVIDSKEELMAGNRSIFSRSLSESIAQAITNREQVILFLNRRGGATFIQCRKCGFVLRCKRCDVTLTYHPAGNSLVCHQCNYRTPVPQLCPVCMSHRIKFLGIGTQKVEQEASYAFPQARLLRWDADATLKKDAHEKILSKFRAHQADIMVGTQMIAKGLDLPLVTLVGVVSADTGLNLPDFRAAERAYQLLSQVAGRAGRGTLGGRVIIQTYSPQHYAIQAAAKHDFALFYEEEIAYRRQLRDPPFARLALLAYSHTNDARCQQEAERMKHLLITERDSQGLADIDVLGPAPAYIHRLRGRFRWQLMLRGSGLSSFLSSIRFPQGWKIDIDPVGLE